MTQAKKKQNQAKLEDYGFKAQPRFSLAESAGSCACCGCLASRWDHKLHALVCDPCMFQILEESRQKFGGGQN